MLVEYLQVAEEENEEPIELPLEKDGTMLLTTVKGVYPGACGMKFRNPETNAVRGVRLSDGVLHPPNEGWDEKSVYVCVFPMKRKMDDSADSDRSAKTKRLEKKLTCSDLICLGLPWKSTEESVRQYFEQFGEVVMVQLKKDTSGSFKGFGFIRFGTYASQMRALAQRHNIDGRWVDVRIPNSKEGLVPQIPCKVFVGRCTEDITADDLREYFSEFGEVTDVFVPRPFRAFGFVTFLDPEVAQSLCGEDHVIKGVSVSVSSAAPKVKTKTNYRDGPSGSQQGGGSWNSRGNSGGNPNFDSLNLQNLGINPNGPPTANVNVPISLVAAALNAGLLGGPNGGQQGGPGNWPQNWQNNQPGQQGNKNWNQGGWNQGQGWGGQGGGSGGQQQGNKSWPQQGGSWPQQQSTWTQPGPAPSQWNNNSKT